jgi:pSer/pThr/pTyr-binding forkhead associated (FHA) protein
MKLVFPNGEHAQVLLSHGLNRIGSSPDGAVVLHHPEVVSRHCEIHVTGTGANLQVPDGGGAVTVNGRMVSDIMALRAGDQIGIGPVQARFAIVEAARSVASEFSGPDEDSGATRVRQAIPKYLLRGVSGAVFGKVFPVGGPTAIGRAPECDISVQGEEISRRHALVKPTSDGLSVEDLGSSNGTYVNGKRVQQAFLNPGDELKLDTVRFIVVAPGMEMAQQTARLATANEPVAAAAAGHAGMSKWVPIMLAAAAIIVIITLVITRG